MRRKTKCLVVKRLALYMLQLANMVTIERLHRKEDEQQLYIQVKRVSCDSRTHFPAASFVES